jgi:hypothetical protein
LLGASVPPHGVTVLLDPSLPSSGWLLAGLHHPLHHVLHLDRRLTGVLLFFHFLRPSKTAWVCSCRCHCDWLVQTAAEAADAKEHETKGLDTDALVLGKMPDAMESDAGLQV